MKQKSFLLAASIFILILSLAYGGYLYWQVGVQNKKQVVASGELASVVSQIEAIKSEKLLGVISAQKMLNVLQDETVKWSQIIKDIQRTIPENSERKLIVEVVSYSGASDSDLTINVSTVPGSENPYFDVANFISAFNSSKMFTGNFVPSISSGLNTEGKEVLTFSFVSKYNPENIYE